MTKDKIRKKLLKKIKPVLKKRTFPFFGTIIDDHYIRTVLVNKRMNSIPFKPGYTAYYLIFSLDKLFGTDITYTLKHKYDFHLEIYTINQLTDMVYEQQQYKNKRMM